MSGGLVFSTGASNGSIGRALALRFARAGYRLALVSRRVAETETWARAQGFGPERAQVYLADVTDPDAIAAAGRKCIALQGVPDVVIASAGISVGMDTAEREDLDVMRDTFATNNVGLAATFRFSVRTLGRPPPGGRQRVHHLARDVAVQGLHRH